MENNLRTTFKSEQCFFKDSKEKNQKIENYQLTKYDDCKFDNFKENNLKSVENNDLLSKLEYSKKRDSYRNVRTRHIRESNQFNSINDLHNVTTKKENDRIYSKLMDDVFFDSISFQINSNNNLMNDITRKPVIIHYKKVLQEKRDPQEPIRIPFDRVIEPLLPSVKNSVQNPEYLIQELHPGLSRGGKDTRRIRYSRINSNEKKVSII